VRCFVVFFFSSRRRHTRWPRDWSSDVCSSDLPGGRAARGREGLDPEPARPAARAIELDQEPDRAAQGPGGRTAGGSSTRAAAARSEERRVGKEGRSRWWRDEYRKNKVEIRDIE